MECRELWFIPTVSDIELVVLPLVVRCQHPLDLVLKQVGTPTHPTNRPLHVHVITTSVLHVVQNNHSVGMYLQYIAH